MNASAAESTSSTRSAWAVQAAASPGASTVAALDAVDPTEMPGADLVDAIVTCERAISHLQATQAALTAAFARPGVAGDLAGLTDNLTRRTGAARGPDGDVDPELLAAHQEDYARSLASSEIAAALAIPHRTATHRVTAAVELVNQLPLTYQALHCGDIDQRRATVIADGTRCLSADLRAAAEDVIVPLAGSRISSHVKELLERAVIAADPDAAARREQDARSHRSVRHRPGENGTGDINAHLRAEDAVTVYTLLDLLAQASSGIPGEDGRSRDIDARRADALTDIANELLATGRIDLTGYGRSGTSDGGGPCDASDGSDPETTSGTDDPGDGQVGSAPVTRDQCDQSDSADPIPTTNATGSSTSADPSPATAEAAAGEPAWRGLSRHGRRPHLTVTVGMSTLAGLDRLPGHLAGHGAITAELATTIAQAYQTLALAGIDGTSGTAQAVSATVYRPRQSLADQVTTLATHCRFPSCRQPGWRTDHDHRVPFNHAYPGAGGLTTLWDCDPECRRHHLLKTHAQWHAEGRPDRTIEWTSPTGHHYTTQPTEYRLPGEDKDVIGTLILPATWPPPKPRPPEPETQSDGDETGCPDQGTGTTVDMGGDDESPAGSSTEVAPPSPEMLRYLEQMHRHDLHMARLRAVGIRARRILAGYRAPRPEDIAAASDSTRRSDTARGDGAIDPCRGGARTSDRHPPTILPATGTASMDPDPVQPGDRFGEPHSPARRHRLSRRDYLDNLAVDRAMRRALGQPDPGDEPPPF